MQQGSLFKAEHLVRIVNEADRQVLAWLRAQVGDARVERAARQLGHTRKPPPFHRLAECVARCWRISDR